MTLSPKFWGLRLLKMMLREYFIIREINQRQHIKMQIKKAVTTLNLHGSSVDELRKKEKCISSTNVYSVSSFLYIPNTVLSTGDTAENKKDKSACHHRAYIPVCGREGDRKTSMGEEIIK